MRAFIDTSALFKKYAQESGTDEFESLLQKVTDIAVSPLTWIEIHSVLARRMRERLLTRQEADRITAEARRDFRYFSRVRWTESLVEKSCGLAGQLSLRTLDSIQLASGVLSLPDCFVTADLKLFKEAQKILKSVILV